MTHVFTRFLTLAAFVIFALAPVAQAQDAADSLTGTIATENDALHDADIAVRIREILSELGGYEDVTVTVSEGIVALRGTTATATEVSDLSSLVARIEGIVAIKNDVTETTDLARRLNPAMDRFQARLTQAWTALPLLLLSIVAFVLIVAIGYGIARWKAPWKRVAPNAFIANLYRQLVQVVFIIFGIVVALDILDASALLSTILGAAGIVGLAFGFAVRDTVENYIASILLSIRQPFRPNDTIEINGDEGKVIRLTSRATILLSFDGNHIRIPNATVFKSRIVNYTQNTERRFKFALIVEQNSDLAEAMEIARSTVQALPFVIDQPAASSWLGNVCKGGIEVTVVGWVNQRDTSLVRARGEALRLVKQMFEANGINLADPTLRVALSSDSLGLQTAFAAPASGTAASTPATAKQPARAVTKKPVIKPSDIGTVTAQSEDELDKIIAAERNQGVAEDLLSGDAMHE